MEDNWFKIIITIAVLVTTVSTGYYFFIFEPRYQTNRLLEQKSEQANSNSFSYQEKCAQASDSFWNKYIQDLSTSIYDGHISHWNKSLNMCFIELSSGGLGDRGISYELADAVSGTEYAEIKWNIPNEDHPDWCFIYPNGSGGSDTTPQNCKSKTEFDSFVKPYMEN